MGCNVPFISNSCYNQEKLHRGINSLSLDFFFSYWVLYQYIGEGNGTPLQYSCLENPMDGGTWKAAVHGVATERLHFHFHTLEKEMETHSSVLAWRIPGTGEPGGLTYFFFIPGLGSSPGEGIGSPLQYSCLENPMDTAAWRSTVHGGHKESDMT